ncbi:secretin N-terminal domain-containing protein [Chlamydiifrater phoenicopteri]|uniref:secretin N-terminal domain-containing protein n=1 Tax=Chlamydiifrater phoenicopteri TaxID=2681469 RepID=UPI001BCC647D|nr:type II secretion system protein GspD [Chlamydiifrater phoenicopteri]
MKKRKSLCFAVVAAMLFSQENGLEGLTIAEKKSSFQRKESVSSDRAIKSGVNSFNKEIKDLNQALALLYANVWEQKRLGASEDSLLHFVDEIAEVKSRIQTLQALWVEEMRDLEGDGEGYVLWHQPDASVYNLVADYGGEGKIYLIPKDIGCIKVSALSSLSVPKECSEESLELVLNRLGVGIRDVSPFIRELYRMQDTALASVAGLFFSRVELESLPTQAYVGFAVVSNNPDVKIDSEILSKFSNPETTRIEIIGGRPFIFGTAGEVLELLKIYDFIASDCIQQEVKLISLSKLEADEMVTILKAAFREDFSKDSSEGSASKLSVVPLQYRAKTLFLSGNAGLVHRATKLIKELEDEIESPSDKTVFWYNVKHSDPEELAALLSRVYDVFKDKESSVVFTGDEKTVASLPVAREIRVDPLSASSKQKNSQSRGTLSGNFIVDDKTGTLIMVVEKEALPQIKMLLKKLDVPKKMIRIEVLLFERKLSRQHTAGLNLLRLGEEIGKKSLSTNISFDRSKGILEFLIGGKTSSPLLPGYDLAYQFLMAQEDVRINASPSVITMNQTPATIAVVEEMSIAVAADNNTSQYNRAQYGVMIKILPTVNIGDIESDNGKHYITLETDITFDTTGKNHNDRPDVTRRHVTNRVRIADGETVIIGGLHCKHSSDSREGIPFLGDIPGIGKLFGVNASTENNTEMFVFITPKILDVASNEEENLAQIQTLACRPGECDEYRIALKSAERAAEQNAKRNAEKPLEDSLDLVAVSGEGSEYDGRY